MEFPVKTEKVVEEGTHKQGGQYEGGKWQTIFLEDICLGGIS